MPAIEANVFPRLRGLLAPLGPRYQIQQDTPDNFFVNVRGLFHNKKPLFFAAVQRKKNYVSLHLMPLYMNPVLQAKVSPGLAKRQQGKACFNFIAVDEALFAELASLVEAADAGYLGWLAEVGITPQTESARAAGRPKSPAGKAPAANRRRKQA